MEINYDFTLDETIRCRGRKDTDAENKEGEYFGNFLIKDRKWALVLWDGDEDPDLYKADLLEVECRSWEKV